MLDFLGGTILGLGPTRLVIYPHSACQAVLTQFPLAGHIWSSSRFKFPFAVPFSISLPFWLYMLNAFYIDHTLGGDAPVLHCFINSLVSQFGLVSYA